MKAVVFDMDGVLVDSEWASSEAWRTALAGFGFQIDEANVDDFVGTTDRALAEFLFGARWRRAHDSPQGS